MKLGCWLTSSQPTDWMADMDIGAYRLMLANGESLESILDDYANYLAWEIRERAGKWTNLENPMNQAVVTGQQLAADQIDPLVND